MEICSAVKIIHTSPDENAPLDVEKAHGAIAFGQGQPTEVARWLLLASICVSHGSFLNPTMYSFLDRRG